MAGNGSNVILCCESACDVSSVADSFNHPCVFTAGWLSSIAHHSQSI